MRNAIKNIIALLPITNYPIYILYFFAFTKNPPVSTVQCSYPQH